jgi:FixJ family two-component response regulator
MNTTPGRVLVVDDDPSVRKSLVRLFRSVGWEAEAFGSADEFLARDSSDTSSCLVLDMRMPQVTGAELQQQLKQAGIQIPIVFLTGHGNVPLTAKAMKLGALDVLTKPVEAEDLLEAVRLALETDRTARAAQAEVDQLRRRLSRLTKREREVLQVVIAGLRNKQIAGELGTTERTVKVHRGRVMQKMEADSVADLVRAAERLGIAAYVPRPGVVPGTHRQSDRSGS